MLNGVFVYADGLSLLFSSSSSNSYRLHQTLHITFPSTLVLLKHSSIPAHRFPFHTPMRVCSFLFYPAYHYFDVVPGRPEPSTTTGGAAIYYDPDSADDIDEDDPDEDLDI